MTGSFTGSACTCPKERRHRVPGPQEENPRTGTLPSALLSPGQDGFTGSQEDNVVELALGYTVMEATS